MAMVYTLLGVPPILPEAGSLGPTLQVTGPQRAIFSL